MPHLCVLFRRKADRSRLLIKDPYSWAASLYRNPYHIRYPLPESFSAFIRHPWPTVRRDNLTAVLPTPLDLWNRKLAGYCTFAAQAREAGLPVVFVKFENLLDDQIASLHQIRSAFGLNGESKIEIKHNIKKGIESKKSTEYYKYFYQNRAWVSIYSSEDVEFANEKFDAELLSRFGYRPLPAIATAFASAVPSSAPSAATDEVRRITTMPPARSS